MEKSRLCAVPSFFWSPLGKLKKYQSLLSPKSDVSTPLNSRKEAHRKIIILVDKALSKAGWQKFAWTRFLPTSAFRASVCSGFNGFNGFSWHIFWNCDKNSYRSSTLINLGCWQFLNMLHCFCSFQPLANYIYALWVQHRGQTLWISLKSLLFCGSLLLPPSPHCPFCLFVFFLHIIFIIVLLAWKTLPKKIDCLKSRGDQSG